VHDLLVKTHPADTAKIEATKRLVIDHFDVDELLRRLDGTGRSPARRDEPASSELGWRSAWQRLRRTAADVGASFRDR
jgi:hypothetical protein